MSEADLRLIAKAVRTVVGDVKPEQRGRGRRPYDPIILISLTYYMLMNGMSNRQMEWWCKENMDKLRDIGYSYPNPPSYKAFQRTASRLDGRTINKITAKIKHLKGEIKSLPF